MAKVDEVYNSMCKAAQDLIDVMDEHTKYLTNEQFTNLQAKISKIHKHMEEYSKKYRA